MIHIRRQRAIAAIALYLFLVLCAGGGTWYLYRTVERVKAEIAQIRGEIASLEAENNAIREFQLLSSSRKKDIERIAAFFPKKDRPLEFIESVEALGHLTGNIFSIDVETPRANDPVITFRLLADGRGRDTFRFFRLVELMPYKVVIDSFAWNAIGAAGPDGEKSRLQLTVRVKSHLP